MSSLFWWEWILWWCIKKITSQIIYMRYSICTSCANLSCNSCTSLIYTSCTSLNCTSNTLRSSLSWISYGKDEIWLWIRYNWLNMTMGWSIWDKKEKISRWLQNFFNLFFSERNGEEEGDWVGFLPCFFLALIGDIVSQWVTRNWRNRWHSRLIVAEFD